MLQQQQQQPSDTERVHDTAAYAFCRQFGGLILGATSCVGTVATYQQHDDYTGAKMLGWLALALIGLLLHEFRPFRRV